MHIGSPVRTEGLPPQSLECGPLTACSWASAFPTALGWRSKIASSPGGKPGSDDWQQRGSYKNLAFLSPLCLAPLCRALPASELPMGVAEAFAVTMSLFSSPFGLILIPSLSSQCPTWKSVFTWASWESQLAVLWSLHKVKCKRTNQLKQRKMLRKDSKFV